MNVDKQTLKDLQIFSSGEAVQSLFEVFDKTQTYGGKDKLRTLFAHPLSNLEEIKETQEALLYLQNHLKGCEFAQMPAKKIFLLEQYLVSKIAPRSREPKWLLWITGIGFKVWSMPYFEYYRDGLKLISCFMYELEQFCLRHTSLAPPLLRYQLDSIQSLLNNKNITVFRRLSTRKLSYANVYYYDTFFRNTDIGFKQIKALFEIFYTLDAYLSMAKSMEMYQLTTPEFITDSSPCLQVKNLVHPFVTQANPNSVQLGQEKNVLFLTGPNMAGKTTFMKACGVAVYLAHLGMGVPAQAMKLSLFDTLFTSIHTEDNLVQGYSYFFSEVRRVKEAAQRLQKGEKVLLIFDELFKGTNVKDALDGSLMVISGFRLWDSSVFVLSSHLIELEPALRCYSNIQFGYFDAKVVDGKPSFTYTLKEGVSKERLGLLILENEGINELLRPLNP